jgi:hypothetical protein
MLIHRPIVKGKVNIKKFPDSNLDYVTHQWLWIPIFLFFATSLPLRREIGSGEANNYTI